MDFPLLIFEIWFLKGCISSSNQPKKSKENVQRNLLHDTPSRKHTKNQVKTPIQYTDLELCNVDYVSSNVKSSQSAAMLYISEDNEAIKMIIKDRSPTMRHVPRTHRELRLIGFLTESTWTQKSKSNMLTPKTNSQTY